MLRFVMNLKRSNIMTVALTFENGNGTFTNVADNFTQQMLNECFVGKDFAGYGKVSKAEKSEVNFY